MNFSLIQKTNDIFFPVLFTEWIYCIGKKSWFLATFPYLRDFRPRKPKLPQSFLEEQLFTTLLCQAVHKSATSVALYFFLVTSHAKEFREKRHIGWFFQTSYPFTKPWLFSLHVPSAAVWHSDGELNLVLLIFPMWNTKSIASGSLSVYFREGQFRQNAMLKQNQLFHWVLLQRLDNSSCFFWIISTPNSKEILSMKCQLSAAARQTDLFFLSQRTRFALLDKLQDIVFSSNSTLMSGLQIMSISCCLCSCYAGFAL